MEPTGMSWFPIAVWLARAGAEAIRVKGKRVKALRRYLSEHAKTDNSDAHTLGAMPSYGGPAFDPVHIPSPRQHALQRLTKQRARYQDAICCSKRRLLDLLRWACPALEPVLPDLRTRLSLALLGQFLDQTPYSAPVDRRWPVSSGRMHRAITRTPGRSSTS